MNRFFLALPAHIDDYQSLQDDFASVIKGRWVKPEKLHLTLLFFGDSYEKELLIEKLDTLSYRLPPLKIKGLGYFKRNRILYANVEGRALQRIYDEVCELFKIEAHRRFVAHVTLMRFKKISDEEAFDTLMEQYRHTALGKMEREIELMQSHLQPDGAVYTLVKRFSS